MYVYTMHMYLFYLFQTVSISSIFLRQKIECRSNVNVKKIKKSHLLRKVLRVYTVSPPSSGELYNISNIFPFLSTIIITHMLNKSQFQWLFYFFFYICKGFINSFTKNLIIIYIICVRRW